MPYYYYGFDWTYIVLVLPCLILSLWASAKVNTKSPSRNPGRG